MTPKGRFEQREGENGQDWLDRLQQIDEANFSEHEKKMLGRAKSCAWHQMFAESEPPSVEDIFESLDFIGEDFFSHDQQKPEPRLLIAEVISLLPENVREWLLSDTRHVFICGYGQVGEYVDRYISPEGYPEETEDGFWVERVIFHSEYLPSMQKDEALWTIAHEIAHSRLNHPKGGFDAEKQADSLATEWGFSEPANRELEREWHKHESRREVNLEMIQKAAALLSSEDLERLIKWAQERL
jgi:hypothetical protein